MAEASAHLVDHVFPKVPVRQWVISFPWRLRYLLALDPSLCRDVRKIFGHRKFKHPTRCTSNSALLQSEPLVHRFRTHRPLPHAVHAVGSGERMYQSQRCEVRHGELRSRIIPGVEIAV